MGEKSRVDSVMNKNEVMNKNDNSLSLSLISFSLTHRYRESLVSGTVL